MKKINPHKIWMTELQNAAAVRFQAATFPVTGLTGAPFKGLFFYQGDNMDIRHGAWRDDC